MRRWTILVATLVLVMATGSSVYAQAPSGSSDKMMGKDKMMDKKDDKTMDKKDDKMMDKKDDKMMDKDKMGMDKAMDKKDDKTMDKK